MEDIHAHAQARQALAHAFGRSRERRSGRRAARGGRAGMVRRPRRTRGRALDGGEPTLGVLLRARLPHWLVGRALGIRFPGYGLHGTSHPQHYPPVARFFFSHLPLLSARADPASLKAATPAARSAMYAAGTVATVVASAVIPGYCWRRGVRGARGFFVGANLWSVPLLLSESLRAGGDLRRAWRELRQITDHSKRS